MQVRDVMTQDVRMVQLETTLAEAARLMGETDTGVLPVRHDDRLVGMITDRDIAVRGVAKGLGPDSRVREVMSSDVKYCRVDDELSSVARNMGDIQVRRLPVVDSEKRLVGIISLADIACHADSDLSGEALEGVARPSAQNNQSAVRA